MDKPGCGIVVFCLVAGLLLGVSLGSSFGRKSERNAAIKAGAAYYEANPVNGDVEFKYKTTTAKQD